MVARGSLRHHKFTAHPRYYHCDCDALAGGRIVPVVVFLTIALAAFAAGSSWGVFAIPIPIVMPSGEAMNVPIPLIIGALLSASSFGSHACFYGDATVLSAQSSGLNVIEHALTQLPYALIAAALAFIGYIAYGLTIT